jgi:hypothetical protein
MNPFVLLRIGAVIAFLFFTGHSLGAPWAPGNDVAVSVLVGAMKVGRVTEMGPDRTFWDLYFGFGVSVSIYLLALAAILWQTASLARNNFATARPFMASLFVCYLAIAVIGYRYFFIIPAAMAAIVCLCIGLAWWIGSRRSNTP